MLRPCDRGSGSPRSPRRARGGARRSRARASPPPPGPARARARTAAPRGRWRTSPRASGSGSGGRCRRDLRWRPCPARAQSCCRSGRCRARARAGTRAPRARARTGAAGPTWRGDRGQPCRASSAASPGGSFVRSHSKCATSSALEVKEPGQAACGRGARRRRPLREGEPFSSPAISRAARRASLPSRPS